MFTPWRSGHCHLRKTLQATRPAPATELCEGICSTTPLCVKSIHPTHTGKSRQKQVCKKLLFMEDDRSLKCADFTMNPLFPVRGRREDGCGLLQVARSHCSRDPAPPLLPCQTTSPYLVC